MPDFITFILTLRHQPHACTYSTFRICPPHVNIICHQNILAGAVTDQYLQEEELLCDLLDEFLGNILWEELCSELKLQRVLLLHILLGHLERTHTTLHPLPLRVFTVSEHMT